VIWPMHLDQFASLNASQQEISRMVFASITTMVSDGLWNLLDSLLSGVWFLGIGLFLLRARKNVVSWITIILSLTCFIDFFGNVMTLKGLAEVGLNIYLILAP